MKRTKILLLTLSLPLLLLSRPADAQLAQLPFVLPTANRALFEPGGETNYFVGTVGRPWTSGTFGCVRSGGWRLHEGLDIRCIERDKRGDPTDPVLATANGTVIYMNQRSSLSNYGIYCVLRHVIQGVDLYSLYAHLSEIRSDLEYGDTVKAGEPIATMGRTTNTKEGISRERAHLHFEINLVANEKFPQWYKKTFPTQRNDHGAWNGRNLLGLDPRLILLQQEEQGTAFDLVKFIQNQTELCRVLVRRSNIPWTRRYPMLVKDNPVAQQEGIAGYEFVFNYAGVPYQLIPRAESEIPTKSKYSLLSVNEEERKKNPGRRIVRLTKNRWDLDPRGIRLLDLLTYK